MCFKVIQSFLEFLLDASISAFKKVVAFWCTRCTTHCWLFHQSTHAGDESALQLLGSPACMVTVCIIVLSATASMYGFVVSLAKWSSSSVIVHWNLSARSVVSLRRETSCFENWLFDDGNELAGQRQSRTNFYCTLKRWHRLMWQVEVEWWGRLDCGLKGQLQML